MENDDSQLVEQLRSTERHVAFDAGRVADRIIAVRNRRRRRDFVAGVSVAAVLLISGFVWRGTRFDPSIAGTNETHIVGDSVEGAFTKVSPNDSDAATMASARLADYERQLQSLLKRIDRAKAAMAAKQLKHESQLFAVYRAHASAKLSLPNMVDSD